MPRERTLTFETKNISKYIDRDWEKKAFWMVKDMEEGDLLNIMNLIILFLENNMILKVQKILNF